MGVLRFGQKVIGKMEKATKFGEKALGSAARFGEKVSGKIREGAIDAGVAAAKLGQAGMSASGNIIRTGRELGAANTLGEKLAVAKDMARQGQELQKLR